MPQDLVGVGEVAAILGVSRQRVNQLVQERDDFPEPEAIISAGRIWLRDVIDSWAVANPRSVARPRTTQLASPTPTASPARRGRRRKGA